MIVSLHLSYWWFVFFFPFKELPPYLCKLDVSFQKGELLSFAVWVCGFGNSFSIWQCLILAKGVEKCVFASIGIWRSVKKQIQSFW